MKRATAGVGAQPLLRRRLTWAFLAFGTTLAVTFLVVVPQLLFLTEDRVFERTIGVELTRLRATAVEDRGSLRLPVGMSWVAGEAVPAHLASHLVELEDGVHELLDVAVPGTPRRASDFMVGVLDERGARSYLLYDVGLLEAFDERDLDGLTVQIVLAGIVLAVAGTVASLWWTRSVSRSLGVLQRICTADSDAEAGRLLGALGRDETGSIARGFWQARSELARALARERRFTRDASHELRTPAAILKGALELLDRRLSDADPRTREVLGRAHAARQRLEDLIVAFLWLARSETGAPDPECCDVGDSVRRVVAECGLAMGLPVDELGLELQIGAAEPVAAPSGVIDVVVRNLLQNALRDRDPGGIVHVSLGGGRLIVANPTTASGRGGLGAHSGERHGFGLSIVGDLCARFGWEFQVRPEAAHFEVVVDFGRGMPH
ncbi:MAG: hypothetical protein RL562_2560 [Planctomycetota bacterium]|jgi:signal transduction histidine kinase